MAGKADVVEQVSRQADLTKKQAAAVFDAIFHAFTRYLEKGERVSVPGFGTFAVAQRAARNARNPVTGETIRIKASKNVRFKPGKDLKEALNRRRP